jgi:cell division protein FtsL
VDYVGIAILIAAVAAALVSIIDAIRTPARIAEVSGKVEQVHELVNSQKAALVAEIAALKDQVATLKGAPRPPPEAR